MNLPQENLFQTFLERRNLIENRKEEKKEVERKEKTKLRENL